MRKDHPHIKIARCLLLLAAGLLLLAAAPAAAESWKPSTARQQAMIALANQAKLDRANEQAVAALNRAYGTRLTPDQVRITSFTEGRKFWSFVESTKDKALGLAITPHEKGPHPHLLVGDSLYDGIQPGWQRADGSKATFNDGTMMRKGSFGEAHENTSRLFCLFNAPAETIHTVAEAAESLYQSRRHSGMNCALLATESLAQQAGRTADSPLSGLTPTGHPQFAVKRLMESSPDLVLQVLPEADYRRALQDPGHLIRFWGDQQL